MNITNHSGLGQLKRTTLDKPETRMYVQYIHHIYLCSLEPFLKSNNMQSYLRMILSTVITDLTTICNGCRSVNLFLGNTNLNSFSDQWYLSDQVVTNGGETTK